MPKLENQKEVLTIEQIQKHLESDKNISWERAESLRGGTEESCVDGRQEKGLIGTPGGNAGEFILFLATIEKCGQEIDESQLDSILERYFEKFGKFYIHTDKHALERAEVSEDELKSPPSEKRKEELLETLTDTVNMGCGHLKLMIENAEEYGVRSELARKAIKSILRAYWETDNVDFEVLEGDHKEGAVVNVLVEIEGEITNNTEIPTISPNVGGAQMFVNHPQVSEFLRKLEDEELEYIMGVEGEAIDHDRFQEKIKELANQQLNSTVKRLAKGLPVYSIFFKNGKLDRIEQVGSVEN